MVYAVLTALFFGITPVCAGRAIRLIGPLRANLFRLLVALAVLGAWAFLFGRGLSGPLVWFFAAGAVGFGIGGLAMFHALPRLGAPLASMIVESAAALCAAALAFAWFRDALTAAQIVFALVVMTGVFVGLAPYVRPGNRRRTVLAGILFATLAAAGQAISITVSRKVILGIVAAGSAPHMPTIAFQRLLGGASVAFMAFLLLSRAEPSRSAPDVGRDEAAQRRGLADRAWFWVGLNALFGPILGVTFLVWALKTMQPGLVQTVAATAPLISVPFARWLEGHRPPLLYYAGGLIALAGLAGIHIFH